MMEFIERFVTAVEKIAACLENPRVYTQAPGLSGLEQKSEAEKPQTVEKDFPSEEETQLPQEGDQYDAILAEKGLKALKMICDERQIPYKAQARQNTILALLREYDKKQADEIMQKSSEKKDPFDIEDESGSPGEEDPFNVTETEDVEALATEVRGVLTQLMGYPDLGPKRISEIIGEAGGTAINGVYAFSSIKDDAEKLKVARAIAEGILNARSL